MSSWLLELLPHLTPQRIPVTVPGMTADDPAYLDIQRAGYPISDRTTLFVWPGGAHGTSWMRRIRDRADSPWSARLIIKDTLPIEEWFYRVASTTCDQPFASLANGWRGPP